MKYSAVVLATAGLAAAQVAADFFPECAISCLDDAVLSVTDCTLDDGACQCDSDNHSAISASATSCIISACGAAVAITEAIPASEEFCAAVEAANGAGEETPEEETPEEETPEEETPEEETPEEETPEEETPAEETPEEETPAEETPTDEEEPSTTGNGTIPATSPVEISGAGSIAPATGFTAMLLAALAFL